MMSYLTHVSVYQCITASNGAAISVNSCLHADADLCVQGLFIVQGKSKLNQERCHCHCLHFSTLAETALH